MLSLNRNGLYCRAGNFFIDPRVGVDHAVITHAHSDHARRGSKNYYVVKCGASLLRTRLGKNITIHVFEYGETFRLGGVQLSFHPAGHILGSSQVRMKIHRQVWVASGDYKRDSDPTCHAFEVVPCDVFVTEATFGTPAYRWNKAADLGREIFDWWTGNEAKGVNSILFAYSLGKAQRILGTLEPFAKKTILCHPATMELNECYHQEGIPLAKTRCISTLDAGEKLSGELLIVPQSFLESPAAEVLGDAYETAFASGWMATQSRPGYDRGFVMSDHADWSDLLRTVQETGARRVFVQHRGNGALVRHLRSLGLEAFADSHLRHSDPSQLALF
jgi:putative mRNA 3-end processing factor